MREVAMKCLIKVAAALALVGCATAPSTSAERPAVTPDLAKGRERADALAHYLTGEIYKFRGDFRSWLGELEEAALADPGSVGLQIRLISAYRVFKDYDRAIELAESTLAAHPDDVSLHIWLGRLQYENGEVERSIQSFEKAVLVDPTSARALEALAELREETNDLVSEVELYERLVEIAPESPQLYYELGSSLFQLGDQDGASSALRKSLSLDENFSPSLYLLGVVQMNREDFPDAIGLFRQFLAQFPDHGAARTNLAACAARKGDYDTALSELTHVIESAEVEPIDHLFRMYLMLRQGGKPDATEAIGPSSAPILGSLLVAMVRKEAGEPYERMLAGLDEIEGDLDNECSEFLNAILALFGRDDAGAFFESRFAELAEEGHRTKALETFRARALLSREKADEAIPILTAILQRYGDDKWTHYYLGTAYEELDQPAAVERHLRECMRLDPDDPDVRNFLGYYLADKNLKLEEAKALIEKALEADPENGYYLDSLGWVYYRQGMGSEAVLNIERAILSMPNDDAVLRDHLGDAYLLNGDSERAVQEWQRARRLDPALAGVLEKINRYSE